MEEDIRGFVEDAQNLTGQGYLMQDEIADEVREAQKDGMAQGEMKAKKETAITLANMGMPTEKIAEAVKVSLKLVQEWIAGA